MGNGEWGMGNREDEDLNRNGLNNVFCPFCPSSPTPYSLLLRSLPNSLVVLL
jgi:hypothetical protein